MQSTHLFLANQLSAVFCHQHLTDCHHKKVIPHCSHSVNHNTIARWFMVRLSTSSMMSLYRLREPIDNGYDDYSQTKPSWPGPNLCSDERKESESFGAFPDRPFRQDTARPWLIWSFIELFQSVVGNYVIRQQLFKDAANGHNSSPLHCSYIRNDTKERAREALTPPKTSL